MNPQYRIFYSWQSDNKKAKKALRNALEAVVEQLKGEGMSVDIVEGGGGEQFISIEDAVRLRIRRCDIFVGDVTPVGNVAMKGKLLPNANVMYELGIASEAMTAERVLAVAMRGDWKPEDMPFDFRQYSMLMYDENGEKGLKKVIQERIYTVIEHSRRVNDRFFSNRLLTKNEKTQKYMPNTYLEFREAKEMARCFVAPLKMYRYLYEQIARLDFTMLNRRRRKNGKQFNFQMDVSRWDIQNKAVDIDTLRIKIEELRNYLTENWTKLDKDGNWGWRSSLKIKYLAEKVEVLNQQLMVVTSGAGQGKTNFVCDLVKNVLQPDGIPYMFVNAYELAPENIASSIAQEFNFIGDGSLENVILKAEEYCKQQLQYFIIVIDGLNEQPVLRPFKNNLLRVLNAIQGYKHVKVLMTCREEFYKNNLGTLKNTFDNNLVELNLSFRRGRQELEEREWDCLMERYAKHFNVHGALTPYVNYEIRKSGSLLLLRIFFETNAGQDVSELYNLDYVELYDKYFQMQCAKIQEGIEEVTREAVAKNLVEDIFDHLFRWMVDTNQFRNLPLHEVVEMLPPKEKGCFNQFMNTNLVLQYDYPENEFGTQEVINFTFEEIRDYLLSKYLIEKVYEESPEIFMNLVENYTKTDNNLGEGVRRFLFLYAKNNGKKEVYESLHKFDWFEKTFIRYILNVKDDSVVKDDLDGVKQVIVSYPKAIVKRICYQHWNPEHFKKLNIHTFFEVIDALSQDEKEKLIDTVWSDKIEGPYHPAVESDRKRTARILQGAIERREQAGQNGVEELKKLQSYLLKPGKTVRALQESADDPQYVASGYEFCRYLMMVHQGKREEFMEKAGVGDGFSAQMMGDIYDAIFVESMDVKYNYETYFKNEYENLGQYISLNYSLPMESVKAFVDAANDKEHRVIDFSSIDYGNDAVDNFVFQSELFERFYNWLNWR